MKWFKRIELAEKEKERLDNKSICIYEWRLTKRKKPFFVGTEIQWLNARNITARTGVINNENTSNNGGIPYFFLNWL